MEFLDLKGNMVKFEPFTERNVRSELILAMPGERHMDVAKSYRDMLPGDKKDSVVVTDLTSSIKL
ncbi:hypothetical protein [Oleiphilus sp. HI0132]|uniref:hypothetical protein n=1 Tax=Oleiphilus sp. HI0132 TaxID=1822270 RepID=UPI0012E6F78A|nr:hypothetical protein [Oleiphilus sp. HI0132]